MKRKLTIIFVLKKEMRKWNDTSHKRGYNHLACVHKQKRKHFLCVCALSWKFVLMEKSRI